jgi:hypothetical protein
MIYYASTSYQHIYNKFSLRKIPSQERKVRSWGFSKIVFYQKQCKESVVSLDQSSNRPFLPIPICEYLEPIAR